jgi:hypothetical protein
MGSDYSKVFLPFSCRTKQPWDASIRRMRSSAQLRERQEKGTKKLPTTIL